MAQPSLNDFLTRFPEFGCVEHSLIISLLAEAPLYVDARWSEYESLGAMLYVAHNLTMQGQGDTVFAGKFKNSGVTSITSGSHKVVYQDVRGAALGFDSTPYGEKFEALANRIGVNVVSVL